MTEEVKVETPVVETPVTEVEYTAVEQEAIEQGWKPKDQFEGDASEWRTAKEFKERGELFSKIENLSKELKSTRSTLTALKGHYDQVKESEFKRALDTLKKEKKYALEDNDHDAVIEIDDKIAEVRATQDAQKQQVQVQPQVPQEFTNWVDTNRWYESDGEMREFADSIGRAYALARPGVTPAEVLKHVSTKVKVAYPDKFVNTKRNSPSPTESPRGTNKSNKVDDIELSDDEQRVMNRLVKSGDMTKEKYIAGIKSIRGIK